MLGFIYGQRTRIWGWKWGSHGPRLTFRDNQALEAILIMQVEFLVRSTKGVLLRHRSLQRTRRSSSLATELEFRGVKNSLRRYWVFLHVLSNILPSIFGFAVIGSLFMNTHCGLRAGKNVSCRESEDFVPIGIDVLHPLQGFSGLLEKMPFVTRGT